MGGQLELDQGLQIDVTKIANNCGNRTWIWKRDRARFTAAREEPRDEHIELNTRRRLNEPPRPIGDRRQQALRYEVADLDQAFRTHQEIHIASGSRMSMRIHCHSADDCVIDLVL